MKVLVCGGRKYSDFRFLFDQLREIHINHPISEIIQGGASGADYLAKGWAVSNDIPQREFKADWKTYGPTAGPIRNAQMLAEGKPDLVVAFPGGPGTADMVRKACAATILVLDLREHK